MKKTTKFLLLISLTGFLVGGTTNLLWGIGIPIGAIFLGLFLLFKVLEKESDLFDEEHAIRIKTADRLSGRVSGTQPRQCCQPEIGNLAAAVPKP